IIKGDIKDVKALFPAAAFDVVTSNPPYMNEGGGLKNPDEPKAIARHELKCDLEDVVSAAAYLLKPGGAFYMVHRPHRLSDIFASLKANSLEPKVMRLVYPFVDKDPNMVLIEARRGGRAFLKVEKPLIVYKEKNVYTDEIYDVYGY
ncbi:MAG: SAM-dependent methyltransferase, partial [Lachnospiraceae bacterium]|nr:SAM-dependent methyltransferase [Lachnospiraceae bacterium]